MPTPRVFVTSGPSGVGKSSIIAAVLKQCPDVRLSISMTTRPIRTGEVDGRDYHFVDAEAFEKMIADHLFLEWARNYDHYYGTSHPHIEALRNSGHHALLDLDTQGALQIQKAFSGVSYIFITPPNLKTLEDRLRGRGSESEALIKKRMARAAEEIALSKHYDHIIENNSLEQAVDTMLGVIKQEVEKDVSFRKRD